MRSLTQGRVQERFCLKKLKYLFLHQSVRVLAAVSLLVFSCECGICLSCRPSVSPYIVCVGLYSMSLKWYNRSFRFFLISFGVIVLNVLFWPQLTLSTVTRSLEPSVTCLPGLLHTVCPQAVAAIWFTIKSHLKVCPNFCTLRVSAGTQLNFGCLLKEILAKIRVRQIKCYSWFSMNWEICQYLDFFSISLLFIYYIVERRTKKNKRNIQKRINRKHLLFYLNFDVKKWMKSLII